MLLLCGDNVNLFTYRIHVSLDSLARGRAETDLEALGTESVPRGSVPRASKSVPREQLVPRGTDSVPEQAQILIIGSSTLASKNGFWRFLCTR